MSRALRLHRAGLFACGLLAGCELPLFHNLPDIVGVDEGDTVGPDAPDNLGAEPAAADAVLLTWTAPGDDGQSGQVARYVVAYLEAAPGSEVAAAGTPLTDMTSVDFAAPTAAPGSPEAFTVSGLAGDYFCFVVVAFDEADNASARPDPACAGPNVAPPAPSGLSVTPHPSGRRLELAWTNPGPVDVTHVVILRDDTGPVAAEPPPGSLPLVGAQLGSATVVFAGSRNTGGALPAAFEDRWLDPGTETAPLVPGATYSYAVFAVDADRLYSAAVLGSGTTADSEAPARVQAFVIDEPSFDRLRLVWTFPADPDPLGALVLRSVGAAVADLPVAGTSYDGVTMVGAAEVLFAGMATEVVDDQVATGPVYHYAVFAFDPALNYGEAQHASRALSSTGSAPQLLALDVSPPVLGLGAQLTVSFTVDRTLAAEPIVELRPLGQGHVASLFAQNGADYTFHYVAGGDEEDLAVDQDNIRIRATSTGGVTGVSLATVQLDFTPPSAGVLQVSGLTAGFVPGAFDLSATFDDGGAPPPGSVCEVCVSSGVPCDESDFVSAPFAFGVCEHSATCADGADLHLQMRIQDEVGNWGATAVVDATCDDAPPTGPTLLSAEALRGETLDLTWDAAIDSGSGVAAYTVAYDTTPGVLGSNETTDETAHALSVDACTTYEVAVRARDVVGNVGAFTTVLAPRTLCGGNGSFAPVGAHATISSTAQSLALGDFNRDGLPDLLVVSPTALDVHLNGGGTFGAADPVSAASLDLRTAVAIDYDRNGMPDVVALAELSVVAHTRQANGTFDPAVISPRGLPAPRTDATINVVTADFNDDYAFDVLFAQAGGVELMRGDGQPGIGDGRFVPHFKDTTHGPCTAVAAADLDRDGHLDAVATCGDELLVYRGLGTASRSNGTFGTPASIARPSWCNAAASYSGPVAIADLDGDAALDLVAGSDQAACGAAWFPGITAAGVPTGAFASPVLVAPALGWPATADVDHDAIIDVVLVTSTSVSVISGVTLDGLPGGSVASDWTPTVWSSTFLVSDLTADRITDVLVLDTANHELALLAGGGRFATPAGGLSDPESFAAGAAAASTAGLALRDVTADGILDVLTVPVNTLLAVLPGNGASGRGDGTFGTPLAPAGTAATDPDLAAGHFDRDGILDVVTANDADELTHYRGGGAGGRGDGSFTRVGGHALSGAGAVVGLTSARLDADSLDDFAVATDDANFWVVTADGLGSLDPPFPYGSCLGPGPMVAADLTNDGTIDLLRPCHAPPDVVQTARGDGLGGFAGLAMVQLAGSVLPHGIAVGDFDSDAIPDLAVALQGGGGVQIFLGNGTNGRPVGTWGAGDLLVTATAPRALCAGDLDLDGALDLVAGSDAFATIYVFYGDGSGTFAGALAVPALDPPAALVIADIDEDGVPDVVGRGSTGLEVLTWRGLTVEP